MKKSKLKKRLRKKYRVGEFRQFGFTIAIKVSDSTEIIDEIIDAIVSEKSYCSGGGGKDYYLLSICPDKRKMSIDEDHKNRITEKIKKISNVVGVIAGPLRDVWHVTEEDFKDDDIFTEEAFKMLNIKA